MGLSNAEKQAAYRARYAANKTRVAELEAEVARLKARIAELEAGGSRPRADSAAYPRQAKPSTDEKAARFRAMFTPEAIQARRDAPLRKAEAEVKSARQAAAAAHPDAGGTNEGFHAAQTVLEATRKKLAKLRAKRAAEDVAYREGVRKTAERSAMAKAQWARRKAGA